ncbi:toxic anion resistance protein, partial [Bacillus altitudinis]|uniref:toxic anion resistance protein n=1 Tax=Bacillus altitudinis TaxID=293387 RepID=UPI00227EA6C5
RGGPIISCLDVISKSVLYIFAALAVVSLMFFLSITVEIARMAGRPSIDIETIESSWNTIVNGMQETKQIEEENKRLREDGAKRILQLQDNIKKAALQQ